MLYFFLISRSQNANISSDQGSEIFLYVNQMIIYRYLSSVAPAPNSMYAIPTVVLCYLPRRNGPFSSSQTGA